MWKNKKKILFLALCAAIVLYIFAANPLHLSLLDRILTSFARSNFSWQCDVPIEKNLTSSGSVKWLQVNCRGKYPWILYGARKTRDTGDLKINLIDANLSDKKIYLTPVLAKTVLKDNPYQETMLSMGKGNPKLLTGINGGYFFINDRHRQKRSDGNCLSKRYPEAGTQGIGDGLLVINKQVYSINCAYHGPFAMSGRSSIIQDTNGNWSITEIKSDSVPKYMVNGLGAGPGLIEEINGVPQIVMRWQGITSTFEFGPNTSVALAKDAQGKPHVVFFTVDGKEKVQGMYATEMANFLYHQVPLLLNLKLISAMSMDQGGSTTMYIRDNNPQVVSSVSKRYDIRTIYNALFIEEK